MENIVIVPREVTDGEWIDALTEVLRASSLDQSQKRDAVRALLDIRLDRNRVARQLHPAGGHLGQILRA